MARIASLAALLVALSGCSAQEQPAAVRAPDSAKPTTPSSSPLEVKGNNLPPFAARADIAFQVADSGTTAELRGKTNLPPRMRMGMLILDSRGVPAQSNWLSFEIDRDGNFRVPLAGLGPGKYIAKLQSQVPETQPDAVQKVIGRAGENLKGPLVALSLGQPAISSAESFEIGGAAGTIEQRQRYEQEASVAQSVYDGLRSLHSQVATTCTYSTDLAFKRGFDARLKEIRSRVEDSLGGSAGMHLRFAADALRLLPQFKPGCSSSGSEDRYSDEESEFEKQMSAAMERVEVPSDKA